ncbi:MAG: cytochrome c [Saprospiraceae bacterium]|nr:cytochrome c [Saprospiraceae bacterium]
MMNIKYQISAFFIGLMVMFMYSCQSAKGNQTGSEYMPDMAHSVAYEANSYGFYSFNRWGTKNDLHAMVQPRNPINGTIARGYAGTLHEGRGITYKQNGSVPYYYSDTEEERTRATSEIIKNPYPITKAGLESGKVLYNINCGICHGEKGDGNGYLVREDGGKYPAQPANFMLDTFINSSNGRYYHSVMYGRNVMGGYSDKLSYEERWNVIHYIRSLQADSKKLVYNETSNTLNKVDVPYAVLDAQKKAEIPSVMSSDSVMIKENHAVKETHTKSEHH